MPELPEVETVRRGLEKMILGKKISSVDISYPKMIKTDFEHFQKELPGQVIESMGRRGKYLLFHLSDKILISHLRMEGKYFYYPDEIPPRKHAHVFIHFEDGGTPVYEDVRKFGTMELLAPELLDAYFLSKKLGPEPRESDFDLKIFKQALKKSKKPIKSHLLNQTLVAGLGNIYVDEVLWRAMVHPSRLSNSLTAQEARKVHDETIKRLLKRVVQRFVPTPMLLARTGPCKSFIKSMIKLGKLVLAVGLSSKKFSLVVEEPTFVPNVKGESDGKNNWNHRWYCIR